jgi:AcrR family transcriptional regulator
MGAMSENTGSELPRALQLLWAPVKQRTRGPAQALSRERIVATAIDLADSEGLQALSMARLADRLGCATMSLYRHVANKDDLQTFMMDAAPGAPPEIAVAPGDWRAELSRWVVELRAVYHRHPWILQMPARPPLDPGQLAWMDAGLRALGGTPLAPYDKMAVIMLILHYVRGEAQVYAGGDPTLDYGELLARLVDAERFPALAEIIEAGVFGPEQPPERVSGQGSDSGAEQDGDAFADFRFGLERILDGVEALIGERAGPTPP